MPRLHRYPRTLRVRTRGQFDAVYGEGRRRSMGPLTAIAIRNEVGRTRLGLSVGRRVGNAPRRNRIKRLLREAFRLRQHDLPAGYDVVLLVRAHEELTLTQYQEMVCSLLQGLHQTWRQ